MSLYNYPPGSEYEYLIWLIAVDYEQARVELDRIWDLGVEAVRAGEIARANELLWLFDFRRKELVENRQEREAIVYRLWLDTRLRAEGSSFAEICERVNEQPIGKEFREMRGAVTVWNEDGEEGDRP